MWLVTGPGGRGMTCSPAIAEATFEAIERRRPSAGGTPAAPATSEHAGSSAAGDGR